MEIAWSLVLFTALTGCGGWLFALVAVDEFAKRTTRVNFPAAVVALVLLAVGGLASVTHLAHPENMLAALNHPTSGIFVEAVLVGIAAAFTFVYLVSYHRSEPVRRICAVAGAVCGVALSFMAGHSYLMPAIATWNTMLLPLAYLGTAMASGVALYCAIAGLRKDEGDLRTYFVLLAASGAVAALTSLAYVMAASALADIWLIGLGGAVVVGGVAPAALGLAGVARPALRPALAWAACACALIGAVCLRVSMWLAYVPLENFFGLLI
ncbi:MAG: dimethyl sulfoxide reductase anchor subunit [Eggerthellaceae bacterium]|nr:dimethyl sulfoxide reductase anchor subunit [Eggerthellaceae bacterium]